MRPGDDRRGVARTRNASRISKLWTLAAAAVAALAVGVTGFASSSAPPAEARALGELFARGTMHVVAGGNDVVKATGRDAVARAMGSAIMHEDGPRIMHIVTNTLVEVDASGASASATSYLTDMQATATMPLS